MLVGRSTQNLAFLEASYLNAEATFLQLHCRQMLPAKKDVVGRLMRGVFTRAKKYGREVEVGAHDVRAMLIEQDFKCALTGMPFSLGITETTHVRPYGPSIDRIDNKLGYVRGNIRIVCNIANIARNAFSDDHFYRMCVAAAAKVEKRSVNSKGKPVALNGKPNQPK